MNHYSRHVAWSDEDEGFIATVPEFPHISAFGQTAEEALRELDVVLEACVEFYEEEGIELPPPVKKQTYSGQLRVRMPRGLHERLAGMAEDEGVSLNQVIVSLLSEGYGYRMGRRTKKRASRAELAHPRVQRGAGS